MITGVTCFLFGALRDQVTLEGSNRGPAGGFLEGGTTVSPAAASDGLGGQRGADLFNFDWDASFDTLSAAAPNFYDPQGELADEAVGQQPAIQDFNIPQPVQGDQDSGLSNALGGYLKEDPTPANLHPGFPQIPFAGQTVHAGVKRKYDAEPKSASASSAEADWIGGETVRRGLRQSSSGRVSRPTSASIVGENRGFAEAQPGVPVQKRTSATTNNAPNAPPKGRATATSAPVKSTSTRRRASDGDEHGVGAPPGIMRSSKGSTYPEIPNILPHEKVFPIQIGSELFRLSGASISSDGYHVQPRDGGHFVKLFADAQFYSLPRLMSQLYESEIFIQIGHRHFQIPRDIFSSPGDSPNFFSLGFAVFFSTSGETFPGLDREGLLRPPSILPPSVPNRSAGIFAELLHMLRGYPLHIRNEEHRAELLRDCRYFHLRGLEQKLIPHETSFNLRRNRSEIAIRLEDIKVSGLSYAMDPSPSDHSPAAGWVNYSRPFADEASYELVLEIGGECTKIDFRNMRADFYGKAKARISSLFQVVANKMNLPTNQPLGLLMLSGGAGNQPASPGNTPLSNDQVKIRIERDAHIILDGERYWGDRSEFGAQDDVDYDDSFSAPANPALGDGGGGTGLSNVAPQSAGASSAGGRSAPGSSPNWPPPPQLSTGNPRGAPPRRQRRRRGSLDDFGEWIVRKGQWRLRVQPAADASKGSSGMEVVMMAVKLDAVSGEVGRNAQRGFLVP
ncbi:MAG: hypothetical protein M1833_005532 [Piccolia ochrophora]|nr:MAG: hypothetical protein M1833_005532 [Piccolia ochrophora]